VARAILDDETHDWHRGVRAVLESGGEALALDEPTLAAAPARLEAATGIRASPTGAAGLAGLRALRTAGAIAAGSRVLVVATGRARV
jgi:threonine synthase